MSQLEPCPHCHRHVKISESACPFCAQPVDFSGLPPRAAPRGRLGRAAVFAFGSAVAVSGCGDNRIPPDAFRHLDSSKHDAAHDAGHDATADAHPDAHPDAAIDALPDGDNDGDVAIYSAAPTDGGTPRT